MWGDADLILERLQIANNTVDSIYSTDLAEHISSCDSLNCRISKMDSPLFSLFWVPILSQTHMGLHKSSNIIPPSIPATDQVDGGEKDEVHRLS